MKHINIASKPGNPSTFWQGESGKYYRTKHEAEADNGQNTVTPEDYAITKTIWDKHKHTIIYSLIAVLFIAIIVYGVRIGKLEIKIK